MAVFSSPLSQENRLQIARASFSSSAISGGRSLSISPVVSGSPIQQDPETLRLLENNQTELVTISNGIAEIRNSINSLSQALDNVSSFFNVSLSVETARESQRQQQDRILAEDALRDETEALIERKAQSSINSTVEPIAQKTTGTLNSLMGVFSTLFLGWLGTGGIQQVQSLANESGNRFSSVKDIVGNGLRFIGNGLLSIKNGFDSIISNIGNVTKNIKDAVVNGLIVAPFRSLFGGGKPPSTPPARSVAGTDDAVKGTAAAADDAAKGTAAAADDAAKGATVGADDAAKGIRGVGSNLLRGAGGLLSAAFGVQDFMERKQEGQTTTQAATGAGGSVVGSEVGALTGARVGSLFGPLGIISGAVIGGGVGWWGGGGLADMFTGVKNDQSNIEPQSQPKVQPQTEPTTPSPSSKPSTTSGATVHPQTPFVSPEMMSKVEEKAETVIPKSNFTVNFGDQITNYTNKLFGGSEQQMGDQSQNVTDQSTNFMQSLQNSMKSFESAFNFEGTEKIYAQSEYKSPEISQLPKLNSPKETTFGPLPEPQPNVIVAPMTSQQKPVSAGMKFTGSASDVPNISSSNPDNFYVVYSKSQYNVMV